MSQTYERFATTVHDTASHLFANQDEAMARLNYLFENRRRAGIVLGASGVGKTALLARFAREVRRAGHEVVMVDLFGTQDGEFLWNLASRLGTLAQPNESRFRLWRAISERLYENRLQGLHTVLLLDNVDEASAEVVTLLMKLIQVDRSPESRLTCVLSVRTENVNRMGNRLLDLIDLRVELEAWSMAETVKFLENPSRPTKVDPAAFTPAALERLHELSGGLPRKITQLAELSQLAATLTESEIVDPFVVENVFSELSVSGILSPTS